ncbi:histidine phosphatase family protein [Thiorhodospira sibirica]|uniref:histidine phosphatase family protein n=1 Tax=Thiorhodospira sibirica TaxID=154347 RepID=UPI00022C0BC3|nr:alpha-ribazole phosphatase family protein [Thiorhodospira sibirica]
MQIDLMRHGQTLSGAVLRGSLDDPLTPAGWQAMQAAFERHGPWDRILSSPLQRCWQAAAIGAQMQGIPLHIEPALREMHFGAWEGCSAAALMQSAPDALAAFWRDPWQHTPPGAEPLAQMAARVLGLWDRLACQYPQQRLLLVTHGGVIRLLLCHLQQRPWTQLLEMEVPHAGIYRITHDSQVPLWRHHPDAVTGNAEHPLRNEAAGLVLFKRYAQRVLCAPREATP